MSDDETRRLVESARTFAALSGTFDPGGLLDAVGADTPATALAVTVDLTSVCDTSAPAAWLMRGTTRRRHLDTLARSGTLASAIVERRRHPRTASTDDLLDALSDADPFTAVAISKLLVQPDREMLTRVAVALERAGAHAPAHSALEAIRAALARAGSPVAAPASTAGRFAGRAAQLARVDDWLAHPCDGRPVTTLFVSGRPGARRSSFLDDVAERARHHKPPWLVVRLDFDRGGLDIQDPAGLTMEIGRQVSLEWGPAAAFLRPARLLAAGSASSTGANVKGAWRNRIPDELCRVLGDAVAASGRPVLLILDTAEVLRSRGETHPLRLFELLDDLCDRGLRPMCVIAAGQRAAFENVPERVGARIELNASESAPTRSTAAVDVVGELAASLERGDIREAASVYGRAFAGRPRLDASESGVVRAFLWRAGRWTAALRDFDPRRFFDGHSGAVDGSLRAGSQTVLLSHLEMWAESRFADLERALAARSHLAELAAELRGRGLHGSLANGALGFALMRVGGERLGSSWNLSDAADAAAALWSATTPWQPGAAAPIVLDALAMPAARFAAHVAPVTGDGVEQSSQPLLPDLGTPAGAARVLAGATPYGSVVDAVRCLADDDVLAEHLSRTDRALAAAGGLPPSGAGGWSVVPAVAADGVVHNLVRLGLLAEWLGAASVTLRHPDLHLIARSAERWRRTCAGDWAYPSAPDGASWSRRPDASIRDRVTRLRSRTACVEQLRIWTGAKDHEQARDAFDRLRRRYPAATREARNTPARDAAAVLLAHDVPAAFVPPMAVLSSLEGKE